MPVNPNATITITAYDWVPWFSRGQVRDLIVRWALEEVGEDYKVRILPQGNQKEGPHRRINPYGLVPTMEEGDLSLYESGAIVHHIASTRPGLLSDNPKARAKAIEWIFAALNTVELPIRELLNNDRGEANTAWSKERRPSIEERVRERLNETTKQLANEDWYGGQFSAGDLIMIMVLRMIENDPLLAEQPSLIAYIKRGTGRPAFQRALAAHMADFTGTAPPQWAFLDQPHMPSPQQA